MIKRSKSNGVVGKKPFYNIGDGRTTPLRWEIYLLI
nr:MAG TPA: hypothetical protein [Caudoviricetes sp.]